MGQEDYGRLMLKFKTEQVFVVFFFINSLLFNITKIDEPTLNERKCEDLE